MQIVINIDEKDYKTLMENEWDSSYADEALDKLSEAFVNSIPLPEHHGRLIDIGKVELVDLAPMRAYDKGWHNAVRYCVETLRDAPTVLEATKEGDGE